jgi:hypothetical protein
MGSEGTVTRILDRRLRRAGRAGDSRHIEESECTAPRRFTDRVRGDAATYVDDVQTGPVATRVTDGHRVNAIAGAAHASGEP